MVKHPQMREWLIETLHDLSDAEYQRQAWVNHNFPPGVVYDDFTEAVHVLLDNTFDPIYGPEMLIGTVFENRAEHDAAKQVANAVEHILKKLGNDRSDAEYLADPDWSEVLSTAAYALTVLQKSANEPKEK